MCCVANIDRLAVNLRKFFTFKRKGLLKHTVDNEVSVLARLTFYKNQLTGQEKVSVVRINVYGCLY